MNVIVKGVSVPKNCYTCAKYRWSPLCPCWHGDAKASYYRTSRHPDCPIVEIPLHGRLIDADALNIYDVSPIYEFCVMGVTEEDIGLAETIIEAEGSEDG